MVSANVVNHAIMSSLHQDRSIEEKGSQQKGL